ncbi:MAG TPA: hypothetical protein VFB16_00430 [Bauldia sp.]|nr:hypothetical protein [Bauldia sp.]
MKSLRILGGLLAGLIALSVSPADAKDMWPPPAKYDRGRLINAKYQTPIIRKLSPAKLIVACQGKHLACSYAEIGSPCFIFLPAVGWEPMLRHEMGHCRGWSADHRS